MGGAERAPHLVGEVGLADQAGADGVFDVVVEVGDRVGELHDLALERARGPPGFGGDGLATLRVLEDAVARLGAEVEAAPVALEVLDDAQGLLVVAEASGQQFAEALLASVAERRVAEVVAERDRPPSGPR